MEKYEQMMVVGEGSYGSVMKCRHRETGQVVAIKKFLDTEEEAMARRMAMREIRMLKKLRHENLVCLIEVFRVRKRFHLVFEFVDRTVLDELEERGGNGLEEQNCRERIFQVIRAVRYCHMKHIIHRDVKPENVLVSRLGVVKLCDFGFARLLGNTGEPCTEYVATRWYRAPELLVADVHYGPAVDVWAIGCLYSEMLTGKPLFPGDSDIDQLYRICKILGQPCYRHQQLIARNPSFKGMPRNSTDETNRALFKVFPSWSSYAIDFLAISMKMDPAIRATTEELIRHPYLNHDRFVEKFLPKLRQKVLQEYQDNPLIRKYQADILAASDDRRQEMYLDRYKKLEAPRWKINIQDPYIKRKTSYVSFSSFKSSESELTNSSKTFLTPSSEASLGEKVAQSVSQKLGTTLTKLDHQRKQQIYQSKGGGAKEPTHHVEQKLGEGATADGGGGVGGGADRPTSAKNVELHLDAPSPLMFQSLQPDVMFQRKTPDTFCRNLPAYNIYCTQNQTVLHPTINNLSFTNNNSKEATSCQKRASQTLPSSQKIKDLSSASLKSLQNAFNKSPVPLTNAPAREQHLKKLGKGLVLDASQLGSNSENSYGGTRTPPAWLNTAGYTTYRKNTVEQTTWTKLDASAGAAAAAAGTDKTSFPSLTGGSPFKKKKFPPYMPTTHDYNNTPRDNSSKSQPPPRHNNNHNLPFM